MSSSATATKVTATRGGAACDAGTIQQSTIYKGIVTPIIFVSFLLSLVWVDIRYTLKRSRNRGHDHGGGWMPAWLHSIMYRRSPYEHVQTRDRSRTPSPKDEQSDFYYHSKQKKLMHMEVDDAFELGFEVFPVVLEYTGTTCQYNSWVSRVPAGEPRIGEEGFWKTYQHVRHKPQVYQFRSFSGMNFAEEIDCKEGNVLDERHVAWERARRGVFQQGPHEQRQVDEERRAREMDSKWYQKIIPGTTADLGKYFAPAIMIVPLKTQLDLIVSAEYPQPVVNVWRYLLRQCEESVTPAVYFKGLKGLCQFALSKADDPTSNIRSLRLCGIKTRDRQEWVDAMDPGLMGDLIMTALVFKDKELFEYLAAETPVHPGVNYSWLCQNANAYGYSVAVVLNALRRFLFQNRNFLRIASTINKMPAYPEDSDESEIAMDLAKEAMAVHLDGPVTASHGRAMADFLKFFKDFPAWSATVDAVISQPRELWKNTSFSLSLLNRMLEVAKRDSLPLDQVKMFYRKYENLIITTDSPGQVGILISTTLKDRSPEAKIARQTWKEPEPTDGNIQDQTASHPISFAVIAGLFRSLDSLDMHEEVANLVDLIVKNRDEIKPIHMATLWLPCLRVLQDLVEETPTFQKLFQTIFELYHKMVFEDDSLQFEEAPGSISPMSPCCKNCKYLDAYLEQPGWKKFLVVKPRNVIEHIQERLREQNKPIETTVYGKNESSITIQLNKASLVNKEVGNIKKLRKQEATKTVRQFEPERLLPFLGEKGDIMWKLGNADASDSSMQQTPARTVDSPSSGGSGLSRTSSSSSANTSMGSDASPCRDTRDPVAKREPLGSTHSRVTPKIEPGSESARVKVEGTPSSSAKRPKDIRDMFASVKKEKTPGGTQNLLSTTGLSTRDRLKNLQPPRREPAPQFKDYSKMPDPTQRVRGSLGKAPATEGASSSSSIKTETPTTRDPLAAFGGIRSRGGAVRNGVRKSTFASAPGLANRANATPGPSSASPASSSRSSGGPDFMSAVLEAERARKGRSNKSTWEVKTESGNVVSSGTASSAMGKSRFDGLDKDKENIRSLGKTSRRSGISSSGILSSRSPNAGTGAGRVSTSMAGSKRKADHDVIDLCSSSPEPATSKRQKTSAPVFDPLDDDPFAD
ncbi:hypothetical protein CkaCkLH20_03242 [Colletotrichum karsti]|uniref:Uncharacterized protein n=1 Tax=Colletotrichum karsti TaxID=1095194 RepID=A0A9P6IAM2_9PEZI|nr:uncharacterized protein CkaCkLH20_03242 [Colletotrichum karsti]KAF9879009.1 hypothetical protein CkaCkLH20_03242 [Colletotrichum karsti]